jgi:hypothetical protein
MRITTCITLIVLGSVLVAAGLGVREVRRQTSPEHVRASVRRQFEQAAAGDLSMDVAKLELPGRLRAEGVSITPPEHEAPLFECERVIADLDIGSLLRGKTVLRRLRVHAPEVKLIHDPERRRWNFRDLMPERRKRRRAEPRRPGPGRPKPGEATAVRETLVDGLEIEDATVHLRYPGLFRDGETRVIEGIYVTARPDHANLERWRFHGEIQRGPLRGVQFSGHYAEGQQVPLRLEVDAGDLTVDRELWRFVPDGSRIWEMFRPEGHIAARGTVEVTENSEERYSFDVTARDVTAETMYAPAPVESLRGHVTVSDAGVFVRDLKGLLPALELDDELHGKPPVHVKVNSTYEWHGGRRDYVVEAEDVPLCRRTLEAVPRFGGEIWHRLQPDGTCRFALRLSDPGDGQDMRVNLTADVRDATLRPPELPRPLENVSARLEVEDETLSVNSFHGLLNQPDRNGSSAETAEVRGGARVPFARERAANVNVQVRNLRLTPALVRAVPSHGERIWEVVQPEATLDGELSLVRDAGGSDWRPIVQLQLHEGRAQLDFWPVPLRELNGGVRIVNGRVDIQRLSARLHTGATQVPAPRTSDLLEADGWVDLAEGEALVNLSAENLRLDRELVTSLPKVGTAIWEQSRPEGICSLAGSLRYRAEAQTPVTCLMRMELHDVSARPAVLPVSLSGLSGSLLISEKRTIASELHGVACAGTFDGAGVAYYGSPGEYPSYAATLHFRQVDLQDLLEKSTGRKRDVAGLLSGTVDIGGVIGGSTGVSARGNVSLAEGRLWQAPFFARLIQVLHLSLPGPRRSVQRGQASFTRIGNKVDIHEFEVVGGGLNVSGYGTVGRRNQLDLTLVALGEPEPGTGIPVLSTVAGWVVRGVGGVLFRIEVSGTLEDPRYSPTPIRTIMTPLTSLRSILFSPIFGPQQEGNR